MYTLANLLQRNPRVRTSIGLDQEASTRGRRRRITRAAVETLEARQLLSVAPTVTAPNFIYDSGALPQQLTFAFNEAVSTPSWSAAVTVLNVTTGATLSLPDSAFSYNSTTHTLTANLGATPIADGNYQATLSSSQIADASDSTNFLVGSDGTAGDPYYYTFFILGGDANHDGVVNGGDYAIFATHFNQTSGMSWSTGDFNYDGAVNGSDYAILATHYNQSLPVVSGTVYNDLNADAVQQPGESGLSGITITATDPSNTVVATATTDASGNYSFATLPTGENLTIAVGVSGYISSQPGSSNNSTVINLASDVHQTVEFPEVRALPAPSNLTAAFGSTNTTVNLSWQSNSNGTETGFHVYESTDGGAFSSTPVATTATGVTTASITGLSSCDHVFRVAAYDANGDSYYSNTADAAAPSAPINVTEGALLDGSSVASVTITWSPGSNIPTGTTYSIFRSADTIEPTTPIASGLTVNSYTDTSVTAGSTYNYWVDAVAPALPGCGFSPQSSPPGTGLVGVGSGGGGGSTVTLPSVPKTVTYFVPVTAGIADSRTDFTIVPSSYSQIFQMPSFNLSLGHLMTTSSVSLTYTDSAVLFTGPGDPGVLGDFLYGIVSDQSGDNEQILGTLDQCSLPPSPHIKGLTTIDLGMIAGSGYIEVRGGDYFQIRWPTPVSQVFMEGLAGVAQISYTYV